MVIITQEIKKKSIFFCEFTMAINYIFKSRDRD